MLEDKVIIVAGGGRGIGEAVAVHLGKLGASVVVNDLGADITGEGESEEPAHSTIDAVEAAGGEGMAHFGDIASLEYTEDLIADTVAKYGQVDGATNFAGILRDSISYKMEGGEWDSVIRVHLRGHFALLRNLAKRWREEAGDGKLDSQRSFLGVSSGAAFGSMGQINYAAAKAGIRGLVRSAAIELHRYNVRVNTLLPQAYTRMLDEVPEEHRPFTYEEKPPENVAPMVAYMMSDEADDITGCSVRAEGELIGFVPDPDFHQKLAFQLGGWTADDIVDKFHDTIGLGEEVTNNEEIDW
jgi:NAD(P)-dependent dehydrogenase (short-subunit alcohol dehydrogenase family)